MGTQAGSSGRFPLDNITYDMITLLYEKSKGLEAFDKYMRDAQGNQEFSNLQQQMRRQDEQFIQQLYQALMSQGGMASRAMGASSTGGGSSTMGGSGRGGSSTSGQG